MAPLSASDLLYQIGELGYIVWRSTGDANSRTLRFDTQDVFTASRSILAGPFRGHIGGVGVRHGIVRVLRDCGTDHAVRVLDVVRRALRCGAVSADRVRAAEEVADGGDLRLPSVPSGG